MLCAGPYPSATIIYFVGVLRTKLRIYMFVAANARAKRELLATKNVARMVARAVEANIYVGSERNFQTRLSFGKVG